MSKSMSKSTEHEQERRRSSVVEAGGPLVKKLERSKLEQRFQTRCIGKRRTLSARRHARVLLGRFGAELAKFTARELPSRHDRAPFAPI